MIVPRRQGRGTLEFNPQATAQIPLSVGRSGLSDAFGKAAETVFAYGEKRQKAQDDLIFNDLSEKLKSASNQGSIDAESEQKDNLDYSQFSANAVKSYTDSANRLVFNTDEFSSMSLAHRNLLKSNSNSLSGDLGRKTKLFAVKRIRDLELVGRNNRLNSYKDNLSVDDADLDMIKRGFELEMLSQEQLSQKGGSPVESSVQTQARLKRHRDEFLGLMHTAYTSQFMIQAAGEGDPRVTRIGQYADQNAYYNALKNGKVELPSGVSSFKEAMDFSTAMVAQRTRSFAAVKAATTVKAGQIGNDLIQAQVKMSPVKFAKFAAEQMAKLGKLPGISITQVQYAQKMIDDLNERGTKKNASQTRNGAILEAQLAALQVNAQKRGSPVTEAELSKFLETTMTNYGFGHVHIDDFVSLQEKASKLSGANLKGASSQIEKDKSSLVKLISNKLQRRGGEDDGPIGSLRDGPKVPAGTLEGPVLTLALDSINTLYSSGFKGSLGEAEEIVMKRISEGTSNEVLNIINIPQETARDILRKINRDEPLSVREEIDFLAFRAKARRVSAAQGREKILDDELSALNKKRVGKGMKPIESDSRQNKQNKERTQIARVLEAGDYQVAAMIAEVQAEQLAAEEEDERLAVEPEKAPVGAPAAKEAVITDDDVAAGLPAQQRKAYPEDTRINTPERKMRDQEAFEGAVDRTNALNQRAADNAAAGDQPVEPSGETAPVTVEEAGKELATQIESGKVHPFSIKALGSAADEGIVNFLNDNIPIIQRIAEGDQAQRDEIVGLLRNFTEPAFEAIKGLIEKVKGGLTEPKKTLDKFRGGFGKREDGTEKGEGFLGLLKRPDGRVSSEISVGIEIDGKETLIPTLVPGLDKKEIDFLLNLKDGDVESIPDSILDKAVAHYRKRKEEGKGAFLEKGEQLQAVPEKKKVKSTPIDTTRTPGGVVSAFDKAFPKKKGRAAERRKAMDQAQDAVRNISKGDKKKAVEVLKKPAVGGSWILSGNKDRISRLKKNITRAEFVGIMKAEFSDRKTYSITRIAAMIGAIEESAGNNHPDLAVILGALTDVFMTRVKEDK